MRRILKFQNCERVRRAHKIRRSTDCEAWERDRRAVKDTIYKPFTYREIPQNKSPTIDAYERLSVEEGNRQFR